ncbi:MAG: hypothetical protein IT436_07480 [Phycisphaerales bacterium]|nr:hypothetical protein [Phycisphaerales bacterium]
MTSEPVTGELPGPDAAGEPRPSRGDARELAELIGAFNEVTARLQGTHEQLRGEVARLTRELGEANQQLERSRRLAALGEMAAGIAHEVRNPLGCIRLYARMLQQDLADRTPELEIVRRIDAAAKGLDTVVGDVLSFAREMKIHPEPIGVRDLLERSLEACRHDSLAGWQHVQVEWEGIDEAAGIEADPGLVQQALVNIIRNAIEAMAETRVQPARLTLAFRAAEITIPAGRSVAAAAIRIADTGPGISEEVLGRMFNPFFTTRRAGTGLGLAIVHRIMDAHGGRVWVGNSPAGGAVFELMFPERNSAEAPVPGVALVVQTPDRARAALEAA